MIIKDIFIQKKILHFRSPLTIAYEKVKKAEVVIIKITDGKGNWGLGSAAPDQAVTGEKIEELLTLLRRKLRQSFFTFPLSHWYRYHEKIQSVFAGFPSGQSAVEEAILNLFTSRHHILLRELFGGYREECETMVTIGIKSAKGTVKEVDQRLREGFKIFKLKCGRSLKEDLEKIHLVSDHLQKNGKIAVDVNQGYTFPQAKIFLERIKHLPIAFVEQPIGAKEREGLKRLRLSSKIPIIADESAVSSEEALNLLVNNFVDGLNIKLMKCGGPINFLKIFHLTKSLNKITMIGCMYESNISLTTAVHLALALPIDYVDLDSGHLDFYDDPTKGGAVIRKGKILIKKPLILYDKTH